MKESKYKTMLVEWLTCPATESIKDTKIKWMLKDV
jgi:hypothetical protein